MKTFLKSVRWLCVCIATTAALTAAASGVFRQVDTRLSFMLIGGGAGDYRIQSIDATRTLAPFTPRQRVRTEDFRYVGPATANVQRKTAQDPEWKTVATLQITEGVSRALVFMLPDRASEGVKTYLLPENGAAAKADELIVFNGTGVPLAVKVGDIELMLQPGGLPPINIAAKKNDVVPVKAAVQGRDGWIKVADGEVQFGNDRRSYLLLLPPRKPRAPAILVYSAHEDIDPEPVLVAKR